MNVMLKAAVTEGTISGIKILNSALTQLISQFADDTTISLEVSQTEDIRALIKILNLFKEVSGLEINWAKSHAFWCTCRVKPRWLSDIGWT